MKTLTLEQLEKYKEEYLETLISEYKDEYYCTPKDLADTEISEFIKWLNQKLNT